MSEELKSCPCCGGKAQYVNAWKVRVVCTVCGLSTPGEDTGGKPQRVWNTRATEASCKEKPDGSKREEMSQTVLSARPKHIDPKKHPLTPDMVGRVVLVDGYDERRLLIQHDFGFYNRTEISAYDEEGIYNNESLGTCDEDDIKYYYFIR